MAGSSSSTNTAPLPPSTPPPPPPSTILPRIQWIEVHEEPWCPRLFGRYLQDTLRFLWENFADVDSVVDIVTKALRKTRATHIIDLCAGGGGPHTVLLPALQQRVDGGGDGGAGGAGDGKREKLTMTLTDLYPNIAAWNRLSKRLPDLRFMTQSVDATNVPADLKGFRTLFNCLHHFPEPLVQAMLQDAVNKKEGVAIFEMTRRNIFHVILTFATLPVLAVTHAVSSITTNPAYFFTFPIGFLVVIHDATVSNLRTYTVQELNTIITRVAGSDNYDWEVGLRPTSSFLFRPWMKAPYLVGTPKATGN